MERGASTFGWLGLRLLLVLLLWSALAFIFFGALMAVPLWLFQRLLKRRRRGTGDERKAG